jgi:GST-like protein
MIGRGASCQPTGEYSIADMAAYPWCLLWHRQGIELAEYPNLGRWLGRIGARAAAVMAASAH